MLSLFRKRETPAQKLQRIVDETRESYEVRSYRERRDAAKLGLSRKAARG